MQHLMRTTTPSRTAHPAGTARPAAPHLRAVTPADPVGVAAGRTPQRNGSPDAAQEVADAGEPAGEDGSLVTEYGLLAVVAATVAGVVITWASGGALVSLFNALLRQARALVGA